MLSNGRKFSLMKRGLYNHFAYRPYCVSFEITYRCNARCLHCHLHGVVDKKVASAEHYRNVRDMVKPVVTMVSGGEPLLRKDVEQIVRSLKTQNKAPFIVMTTNGILLTKEKYQQLREAGVDEFSISLDYPDERHDEFRQVPGLFKKIEKLVTSLNGSSDKGVTVSCVIQSDNYKEAIKVAQLAKEWNIPANYSSYTWLRTKNKDYMIPQEELEDLRKVVDDLIEYKRKYKNIRTPDYILNSMIKYFRDGEISDCRAGRRYLIVNPDGTFSPCGLITKDYHSLDQLKEFNEKNTCGFCYTSLRANTEMPLRHKIRDHLNSK